MPAERSTGDELSSITSSARRRAGDHAALAVEDTWCRCDDEVGPELTAAAAPGEQKQLSTASSAAAHACDLGQRGDVADLRQRVARRLGEQQLRVRAHRIAPLGDVGLRDEGRLDAEASRTRPAAA
jgi:hypothetical protein